jgi:hypothetical protein
VAGGTELRAIVDLFDNGVVYLFGVREQAAQVRAGHDHRVGELLTMCHTRLRPRVRDCPTADTAEAVRQRLADDWWDTASPGLTDSIMIALRRDDVADLNRRARAKMLGDGRLTGATITHIHLHDRAVDAVDDRGVQLRLPADYLDAGHLTHGYAITGHKAQGLTCDHTYTLGTETLYREWGYVAMSRGRLTNQLYQGPNATGDDRLHHHDHLVEDVPDLTNQLRRSRAEQPSRLMVAQLASTWRSIRRYLAATAVQQQPHVQAEQRRTSEERVTVVQRLGELQQRQASTVGPVIRRRSRAQRAALAVEIERHLERLARLDETLEQLNGRLADLPTSQQITAARSRLRDVDTQLRRHSRVRAACATAEPPPYLHTAIGSRPPGRHGHNRWQESAAMIEDYRLRRHVTDPDRALGVEPADPIQRADRRQTLAAIVRHQREQQRNRAAVHSRGIDRSH